MEAIQLEKVIIHKVDHVNYDKVLLSDMESPISDEAGSFLRKHILNNYEHRFTRSAVFQEALQGKVCLRAMCETLAVDPEQFVSKSREIAQHLFAAIESSKNKKIISPGDLVVCTFHEEKAPDSTWVALLKMDPEDGFIGERVEMDGKVQTVLKRVKEVIPTGELQKCAFILPNGQQNEHLHLRVLDQQAARYGIKRLVASFFLLDFLQCQVKINPSDQTRVFIYVSNEWLKRKEGFWKEEDINRFTEVNLATVQNEQVDLADFARQVIPTVEEQEDYIDFMVQHGITDLTFCPDPDTREKWTRYAWYEGENGLLVRIDPDAVGPGKTLTEKCDPHTHLHTILLTTSKWVQRTKTRA